MTKAMEDKRVWNAIADTPEEAANLRARSDLMMQIAAIVKANDWKQAEAAAHCGVTSRASTICYGDASHGSRWTLS
ncbi:XRE family transcriptional regulator [Trinickia sp. Y13]|nr:XRE family transcriptional regulator [Trinickia sp. Y13]MDG0027781.1 XRE family transcriptional regulator [Trinickia sp. Y13]